MEIHHSAHRHGSSSEDIRHAVEDALVAVDMDPNADPPRVLVIGPDRAGNPVEIVILELAGGSLPGDPRLKLRPAFYGLLEEEGHG